MWELERSRGGLFMVKTRVTFAGLLASLLVGSLVAAAPPAATSALDGEKIEQLTGAKGKLDEKEGVFKVSVPRSDLKVTAAGVRMTPALGLTSWAAFERHGKETMVMGDIVVL